MTTLHSKREADIFLAGVAKHGSGTHCLYIDTKETLRFPGVRWLASLDVTVGDGAEVHFPDLEFVSGSITVLSLRDGMVYLPKLAELGGGFDATVDDTDSDEEFSCLAANCRSDYTPVVMPEKVIGYTPQTRTEAAIYLANDRYHTLYYRPDTETFYAGCRNFRSIDKAIKHWTTAIDEEDDGFYSERLNRALMFVLALTNFKEELKHV